MAKRCPRCGNDIGYPIIHDNLHTLFLSIPELKQEDNNVILIIYWIQYDEMLILANRVGVWPRNAGEMTSMQRIDREIRNILQPSKERRKSRELQEQVREEYARDYTIQQ